MLDLPILRYQNCLQNKFSSEFMDFFNFPYTFVFLLSLLGPQVHVRYCHQFASIVVSICFFLSLKSLEQREPYLADMLLCQFSTFYKILTSLENSTCLLYQ